MEVLVLGAAGFVGLHVVDALLGEGVSPVAGIRRKSWRLGKLGVPTARVDLDDPDSLVEAMRYREVVVHAAGHYPRTSLEPERTLTTGLRQQRAVLDAAVKAGVRRMVYVSSTATVAPSASGGRSTEADRFPAAPRGTYHSLKWHTERLALEERRLEVVVACPAGCIGPWDLRVGTCAPLVAAARGLLPRHPDGVVNLVDVRDAALGIARLVTAAHPPRRVLLSARDARLHDLLLETARRYGTRPPDPPIPVDEARASADEAERRFVRDGTRPWLPRELVDLVVNGVPIDASASAEALGLDWTPWEQTLSAWEAWARRFGLIQRTPLEPS